MSASPVTRFVPVGFAPPPENCWAPQRSDLPRTNGVAVSLACGAYATVYRSECPRGPEYLPQGIWAGDGADSACNRNNFEKEDAEVAASEWLLSIRLFAPCIQRERLESDLANLE